MELNPLRKIIRQHFDKLIDLVEELNILDQVEFIYDYFAEIKNKIDLYREELLNENYIENDQQKIMKIP